MSNQEKSPPPMAIKVAKVIDEFTLVINKGERHGLKVGQRLLVYAHGDEIADPDTKLSLGKLEIVKGTGRITHLQESLATIRSDMTASPARTIRKIRQHSPFSNILGMATEEVEEKLPPEPVAFEAPAVGDLVKPV